MSPLVRKWLPVVLVLVVLPLEAGQLTWNPGAAPPALRLNLGDGALRRTLEVPSGATSLELVLDPFLVDDPRVIIVWTNDGQPWTRQAKKIPGGTVTQRVTLPPGRALTLEITTFGGTLLAVIKLRRS